MNSTVLTEPVVVRVDRGSTYLGLLAEGTHGPNLRLRSARPLYQWPTEGIHALVTTAHELDTEQIRIGVTVPWIWLTRVTTIWAVTTQAWDVLSELPVRAGRPRTTTLDVAVVPPQATEHAAAVARIAASLHAAELAR